MVRTNKGKTAFKANAVAVSVACAIMITSGILITETAYYNNRKQGSANLRNYIFQYSEAPLVRVYKVLVCLHFVGHIPMDYAIGKDYLLIILGEREFNFIETFVHYAKHPIANNNFS